MDLSPSAEQQQLVDAFSTLYAKESSTDRVRAAEASGHDPALWRRLGEVGVLEMAVGEQSGGWGASLSDLGLVAEQHGRHLGSAPLIEAQAAARLLARVGGGAASGVLARHWPATRWSRWPCTHRGTACWAWCRPARSPTPSCSWTATGWPASSRRGSGIGSPRSDRCPWPMCRSPIPPSSWLSAPRPGGPRAGPGRLDAADGVRARRHGLRSIEIGVEYVKERHAFGVPIGSFQAVAHGLADAATAVEGQSAADP